MAKEAAQATSAAATTTAAEAGFLDQIIKATKPRSDTQVETAERTLQEIVGKPMQPGADVSKDVHKPTDSALLERVGQVAAAAHAPFISAANPELCGLDTFTEIDAKRDLAKIFDSVEYAKWKSFRESEDSRYVGLCLPHTLMRLPYGDKTRRTEGFRYEEDVDGRDHKKYLWGNAAYAMGARITDSFAKCGWL